MIENILGVIVHPMLDSNTVMARTMSLDLKIIWLISYYSPKHHPINFMITKVLDHQGLFWLTILLILGSRDPEAGSCRNV